MSTAFEIPEWLLSAPPPPAPPADDHRIEEMVNHFIAGKQEALFTAPDAFYRLEGVDAIDGQPAINDRLQALRAATLDLARDDSERAALGPRLDLHIDDAADGIARHVAAQRRVYQRQVVAQRQALIQRAAELEHDNDAKILGLAEANATAAREGARMDGIAPDSPQEAAAILGARSDILRRAIDERIANRKGAQALALFDHVKDRLAPPDLRRLNVAIEAARNEAAVDAWLQREATKPGPPLMDRAAVDPALSPDQRAIATVRSMAQESAHESDRVATIQGLDDQLASARRTLATAPSMQSAGTFSALTAGYTAAGAPEKAAEAGQLAALEPFLRVFAQASPDRQQRLIYALSTRDRPAAEAIQRAQSEAFARNAFDAGTKLYPDVGPPVPVDDMEGRIRQARTIAARRQGIPVSPFTAEDIQSLQRGPVDGLSGDGDALLDRISALPADMRQATLALLAPRERPSADSSGSPAAVSVAAESEHDDAHPPLVTAQVFPPTIIFGRLPPVIRPVPPIGEIPTPEGMTPLEQLPPGSSGGSNAEKPFQGPNLYPEGTPCTYCGKPTTNRPSFPNSLERDHIIPRWRGGNNDPENEAPACRTCNRRKGPRTPPEWYWQMRQPEA
ncbi:MAG TPA: HNH endonuclease [Reyranella sp.]|nr:HNH endonuclease [Reyranella sp.]